MVFGATGIIGSAPWLANLIGTTAQQGISKTVVGTARYVQENPAEFLTAFVSTGITSKGQAQFQQDYAKQLTLGYQGKPIVSISKVTQIGSGEGESGILTRTQGKVNTWFSEPLDIGRGIDLQKAFSVKTSPLQPNEFLYPTETAFVSKFEMFGIGGFTKGEGSPNAGTQVTSGPGWLKTFEVGSKTPASTKTFDATQMLTKEGDYSAWLYGTGKNTGEFGYISGGYVSPIINNKFFSLTGTSSVSTKGIEPQTVIGTKYQNIVEETLGDIRQTTWLGTGQGVSKNTFEAIYGKPGKIYSEGTMGQLIGQTKEAKASTPESFQWMSREGTVTEQLSNQIIGNARQVTETGAISKLASETTKNVWLKDLTQTTTKSNIFVAPVQVSGTKTINDLRSIFSTTTEPPRRLTETIPSVTITTTPRTTIQNMFSTQITQPKQTTKQITQQITEQITINQPVQTTTTTQIIPMGTFFDVPIVPTSMFLPGGGNENKGERTIGHKAKKKYQPSLAGLLFGKKGRTTGALGQFWTRGVPKGWRAF